MSDAGEGAGAVSSGTGAFEVMLPRGRVRYRDAGPPASRIVVLLHGLGHDSDHWAALAPLLARTHRVIAPDLPGHSQPRDQLSLRGLGEVVADLVAALGVGRVTLIGHDTGAAVALVIATEWPEFVERLVLIAPPILPRRAHVDEQLALLPVLGRALFRRGFGRLVLRRRGVVGARVDETTLPLLRETSDRPTLLARLPRVRCPTLLVFGREDPIEPWTHGPRLSRELSAGRLEVIEGGHCPAEEAPGRLAALVERFLAEPVA